MSHPTCSDSIRTFGLRAKIVDQAAQLGGEAVIVGPESKETEFIILTTGIIPSEKKKLSGEVIVFR